MKLKIILFIIFTSALFTIAFSEDFWMNLQLRWDLYKARLNESKELREIRPLKLKQSTV